MPDDLSLALSEHAAGFAVDDVDGATLAHLKDNLLDVVAVTIAGVHEEGLDALRQFLRTTSATGAGVVVGTPARLSTPAAAFANATAAHALEFDDAYDEGGGMHAGPPVHATALAVADELGSVSGAEYLAAVAVGLDVAVRLATAPEEDLGWHRASVYAVFGATVAAGRLLGLDAEQMRNAIGLALSQASGTRQPIAEATLATRLHTGFAARNAVTAAALARAGFTAAHESLEGPNGFFTLFQGGKYDRDVILAGLGTELRSSRISTKPFPGGRVAHALVEAALRLRSAEPDEAVEAVAVSGPAEIVGWAAAKSTWPVGREALYNPLFAVALAVEADAGPLRAFVEPDGTPAGVRRLFERSTAIEDPSAGPHGAVELTFSSGRTVREVAERATGYPERPLGAEALRAKLRACVAHAGVRLDDEAIADAVARFDQARTTSELTQLLSTHT
ncbi:MAG: MmgE/PrpD family protein [Actinomycetota bacterium]